MPLINWHTYFRTQDFILLIKIIRPGVYAFHIDNIQFRIWRTRQTRIIGIIRLHTGFIQMHFQYFRNRRSGDQLVATLNLVLVFQIFKIQIPVIQKLSVRDIINERRTAHDIENSFSLISDLSSQLVTRSPVQKLMFTMYRYLRIPEQNHPISHITAFQHYVKL
ncbi:hypothetical protein D3C71_1663210 [compost metagenome]